MFFLRRRKLWFVLGVVCLLGIATAGFLRQLATWHSHPSVASSPCGPVAPWTPEAPEGKLRLVTWNVWGLPGVTPHRRDRIRGVAKVVAGTGADIACFQEVFLETDRRTLCETLAEAGLRHYRYFASPAAGSGLLTVSRHPILDAQFHRFAEQGNPLALNHGDWWAGKGIGTVTVDVTRFGKVQVMNTHLHARYGSDRYRTLREHQLQETADLAASRSSAGCPTFLLGDLNFRRHEPYWRNLLGKHLFVELSEEWAHIDYILAVSNPRLTFSRSSGPSLKGTLPDGTPLSDHPGIVTDVRIQIRNEAAPPAGSGTASTNAAR